VDVFWFANNVEGIWFSINPGRSSRAHDTFISDVWRVKGSNFERTFKIGEGKFKEQNKNINVSDL